jgi:hypothetical protein
MMRSDHLASLLWDLVSSLRSTDDPLLPLDVVRCLLFLRYASSDFLLLGREKHPLVVPAVPGGRTFRVATTIS